MIAWLALIPAIFLAMLAMERLEEHLVPNSAEDLPRRKPRSPDGSRRSSTERPEHPDREITKTPPFLSASLPEIQAGELAVHQAFHTIQNGFKSTENTRVSHF